MDSQRLTTLHALTHTHRSPCTHITHPALTQTHHSTQPTLTQAYHSLTLHSQGHNSHPVHSHSPVQYSAILSRFVWRLVTAYILSKGSTWNTARPRLPNLLILLPSQPRVVALFHALSGFQAPLSLLAFPRTVAESFAALEKQLHQKRDKLAHLLRGNCM